MNKLLIFAVLALCCQQIFCTIERKSAVDFPLNITRYIHGGHGSSNNSLHRKEVIGESASHSGHSEPSPSQLDESHKTHDSNQNSPNATSTGETNTQMNSNYPHDANHEPLPSPSLSANLTNPVLDNEKPSLNTNEFLQNVVLGIFISFFGVGTAFLIINYLRNAKGKIIYDSLEYQQEFGMAQSGIISVDFRDQSFMQKEVIEI